MKLWHILQTSIGLQLTDRPTVQFTGLAGLAAAISIQSEDFQVTVLESTKELTEVGAGLQIVSAYSPR